MVFYKLSLLIVLKRFIKLPTQRYGSLQSLFGWKLFVVGYIYLQTVKTGKAGTYIPLRTIKVV